MKTPPSSFLPAWDFRGECLILSGGARGIGAGLVSHFARCGADVVFGDTDRVGSEQLCESLTNEGASVHFVETDFTTVDAWRTLREKAEQLGFRPSIVIPNVGINIHKTAEAASLETFERITQANFRSAWLAAREFAPLLKQREGASILLIGTVMARFGTRGYSFYTATKAALSGLLKALCVEMGPSGIRVNMVVPGYILNDPHPYYRDAIPPVLWREFHERFGLETASRNPPQQPLAFWGEASDIAQAASFLHSAAARYISGVELPVDGGLLCQTPIHESVNDQWHWTPAMIEWLEKHELAVPAK